MQPHQYFFVSPTDHFWLKIPCIAMKKVVFEACNAILQCNIVLNNCIAILHCNERKVAMIVCNEKITMIQYLRNFMICNTQRRNDMLNKAILIGNLGQEPDIRHTNNGKTVANISIATTEKWKDKNGAKQEKTEWHRVVFFGGLANVVQQYLHKGSKVYIEGAIRTNEWVDNEGQKKWSTKIYGAEMKMLDSKPVQPAVSYPAQTPTQAPNDYTPQPNYGDDYDRNVEF